MKKIYKNKIENIPKTDIFDNKFLFEILNSNVNHIWIEIIYMKDLLEKKKNYDILEKIKIHPAMYEQVYSAKDELKIFEELFNDAINNNKKIHLVWITLDEEVKILENYYNSLNFFKEEINCFEVDFSKVLFSASVNIENLIRRWSDYKRMWKQIFFNPPIRESGQTKALFKWINRWVIAWINLFSWNINLENIEIFLKNCILEEHILAITLAKVLCYNLEDFGLEWEKSDLIIEL